MNQGVVLASTSLYRAELLARLGLEFKRDAPHVDEALLAAETAPQRAERLAHAKATALLQSHPNALLIGSDQVAACEAEILRKPGSEAAAIAQLMRMRGRTVIFYTSVCVFNAATGQQVAHLDTTTAVLRADLTEHALKRYVQADQPLNCAGSFKVESLGISLFDKIESEDPTALIGLPLIAVARALRKFGLTVP